MSPRSPTNRGTAVHYQADRHNVQAGLPCFERDEHRVLVPALVDCIAQTLEQLTNLERRFLGRQHEARCEMLEKPLVVELV